MGMPAHGSPGPSPLERTLSLEGLQLAKFPSAPPFHMHYHYVTHLSPRTLNRFRFDCFLVLICFVL
jgi:hypothetical protein